MNTHIINKQIIDLKVDSEENAFGFQQQVRDAYMNDVLPLIGEILDEIAGPDEIIRIDRLELDFGTLSPGKMEQQMKERIREALMKQLPAFKRKISGNEKEHFSIFETVVDGNKSTAQLMSESFSQRELLETYFETGFLPWWAADEIDAPDVDAIIISLFEKEPVSTLQWLQQLGLKSPQAIRRLVMQVEKPTQQFILAAFPAKIIAALQTLTKQIEQVKSSVSYFPWQKEQNDSVLFAALILPVEIVQTATEHTNQEVLETLIAKLSVVYHASQSGIEKQLYANTLSEVISSDNKITVAPDLVEYFINWEKTHPEIASSVSGSVIPAMEIFSENDELSISALVETIEQALKEFEEKQTVLKSLRKKELVKEKRQSSQQKAYPKKKPGEKKQEPTITKISQEEETAEESMIAISENSETVNDLTDATEFIPSVEEPGINSVADDNSTIEIIAKDERSEFVQINWLKPKQEKEIEKTQEPLEKEKTTQAAEEIAVSQNVKTKISETESAPVNFSKKEKEEITPVNEAAEKNNEDETTDSPETFDEIAFEIEDHPMARKKPSAGMTRFGGIVLIAPFLPAFFSELKLIDNGKFPGEAEQHKALHLLNFLASGKTSSPEYALLLHKLLCGIEITKPVPKTIKLSAAEKKEALIFLDDIAEQWKALRSTSGIALRDTFFRRNGILEKKDNIWLLRVERGPMDIMLDTLPWTISILKAPWMQQLLQVEW